MRPASSPDRLRFATVAIVLACGLPIGSRALGDKPPGKTDPLNRVHGVPDFVAGVLNPPKIPWLDKVVVLKSLKTDLRIESKAVPMPAGRFYREYTVKKVEPKDKGEWLWIVDGRLKGWVDSTEVIPKNEAYAFYSGLIDRNPRSAEAFYLRGALGTGDDLADLNEALRLDPRMAVALVARADVYSDKRKDDDRALADLAEAIRLDPNLAEAYFERALILHETDPDQAIADLNQVIRLDPGDPVAFANRGGVFNAKEEWDRAISDLTEAIRLTPRDEDADFTELDTYHAVRAYAHTHLGQYDRAIADYTEALKIADAKKLLGNEGFRFACLFNRANVLESKKDYAPAIEGFTQIIGMAPEPKYKSAGYAGRAWARWKAGDVDDALADYAEALRLDPLPVVAAVSYINRGLIESDRDDPEAALADYSNAVQLLPKEPIVFVSRARVLTGHGRHEPALADCDRAIQLAPANAWGHDTRAWIRATCPDPKFRDGKKAVEGATRACELTGWKKAYCLETLAAAQAEVGDFDAAVKWQTRAFELAKDDESRAKFRERLELFRKKQPYRDVRLPAGDRRANHFIPEIPLTAR